jgi:glycosyltransferase involved in cell wall biosynthesis
MKQILFYTHNIFTRENPQGYRIHQYFPYLEKAGFSVKLFTTRANIALVLKEMKRSHITYIQRVLPNPVKLYLFRQCSRIMTYDFDDAVMYGKKGNSSTRVARFKAMMRACDAVFCGNHFLLDEAKKYKNDNVYYIPTVVDTEEYPVKQHEEKRPFVVGWMGSASTLRYLSGIEDVLMSVADSEGMACKIVADRPPAFVKEGIVFERWNKDREKQTLLGFDVGIMPANDDPWTRGKCGLKLLQYMAAGLPSIAHPAGVAPDMIIDGQNGFLRGEALGWKEAIDRLGRDVSLRKRMGKLARAMVEERYALSVWGPKVAEIVSSL